jgi:hypothetical protein
MLQEGRLKSPSIKEIVTYHDPCHLRHFWNFDSPRDVISQIPGAELVEMPRNREEAYCCGAGGGVRAAFPDLALTTARERVEEAVETGAGVLITSCPFCVNNLSYASKSMSNPIKVMDITTYLLERITGQPMPEGMAVDMDLENAPGTDTLKDAVKEDKKVIEKDEKKDAEKELIRCNVCGFTTSSHREMSKHMLEHSSVV